MASVVYISRTESFSACHRLHSAQLSEKQNEETFGKCNNPNGHGHNYKVEVTLRGPVDPVNGMVYNLTDLKKHMKECVMDVMDHRNIDKDVLYFNHVVSSAENIAVFVWKQLKTKIPASLLYEVKIYETDKNVAIYKGEETN